MALLHKWIMVTIVALTLAAVESGSGRRAALDKRQALTEGDYADRSSDGSYAFRYADRNQFHLAAANKDNVVSGRFGSRSPETDRIVQTSYSAGPRGFRARGPDIARQTDLSQVRLPYSPPVPVDSPNYDPAYDRYHDPNEDPSYKFTVRTPTHSKTEASDSNGHVEGAYSYLDDVGKRHDVQYEAGAGTGFHIKSAHPDSDPFGGVFYSGPPGKPGGQPRGHSSVVIGKDGSYGFTASGPDQRRTEVSDSSGRVQGSYTYVDDKGVQRTVQYVAGPDIGYRVVNNAAAGGAAVAVPAALLPSGNIVSVQPALLQIPSSTPLSPSAFEQDLFGPAASSTATPLTDRRRPESSINTNGGIGGASSVGSIGSIGSVDGGSDIGGGSDEFLSPGSSLPLGSAFPEDDPALPPKKRPTVYKNKDEESFFQSFDKYEKRREQQAPKKSFAVPDLSPYGQLVGRPSIRPDSPSYSVYRPTVSRPTALPDTLYGQPSRPIVVDDKYSHYGGTDYQKPKDRHRHYQHHSSELDGHDGNGYSRLPPGTIIKAHVQNIDILPFGHRVPSPSYVLEKQYGDDYQNSIKK